MQFLPRIPRWAPTVCSTQKIHQGSLPGYWITGPLPLDEDYSIGVIRRCQDDKEGDSVRFFPSFQYSWESSSRETGNWEEEEEEDEEREDLCYASLSVLLHAWASKSVEASTVLVASDGIDSLDLTRAGQSSSLIAHFWWKENVDVVSDRIHLLYSGSLPRSHYIYIYHIGSPVCCVWFLWLLGRSQPRTLFLVPCHEFFFPSSSSCDDEMLSRIRFNSTLVFSLLFLFVPADESQSAQRTQVAARESTPRW